MDIFYHPMNYSSKGIIDAAYCGAFKRKSVEETNQLIEDLAKRNYRARVGTSCDAPKSGGPLTTCQPVKYSWMSGYPTPLMKIGHSLLCMGSST